MDENIVYINLLNDIYGIGCENVQLKIQDFLHKKDYSLIYPKIFDYDTKIILNLIKVIEILNLPVWLANVIALDYTKILIGNISNNRFLLSKHTSLIRESPKWFSSQCNNFLYNFIMNS